MTLLRERAPQAVYGAPGTSYQDHVVAVGDAVQDVAVRVLVAAHGGNTWLCSACGCLLLIDEPVCVKCRPDRYERV